MGKMNYKDAGVDIDKKADLVKDFYTTMRSTFGPRVIENPNGFGGLFLLNQESEALAGKYKNPVLVSSTDGVGTKLKIAFMMNKHDTIGIDLVAMCVNDVLTLGAEMLFFLDYLASSSINPDKAREIIKGIAIGCKESNCALIGGETPELPGFYKKNEYDLAGFAVGVVEKDRIINGANIKPGDIVIGLKSSGVHSNGYSLIRKVLFEKAKLSVKDTVEGLNTSLGEELLKPTKIYVKAVRNVLDKFKARNPIKGIAHITGGGLIENVPRILPQGCAVNIKKGEWEAPAIFNIVKKHGNINENEMYRVFNMGIGMVLIVSKVYAETVIKTLNLSEEAMAIGNVVPGNKKVSIK